MWKSSFFWLLTEAGSSTWSFIPVLPCTSKGHSKVTVSEGKPHYVLNLLPKRIMEAWIAFSASSPLHGFRLYCLSLANICQAKDAPLTNICPFDCICFRDETKNVHTKKFILEYFHLFFNRQQNKENFKTEKERSKQNKFFCFSDWVVNKKLTIPC